MSNQYTLKAKEWNPKEVTFLIQKYTEGYTVGSIAKALDRGVGSIKSKLDFLTSTGQIKRKGASLKGIDSVLNYEAPEEEDFNKFFQLEEDKYILFSDTHCPYFHKELFFDYVFPIAKKFKVKKAIIAGDFLNMEAVSSYVSGQKGQKEMEKEFTKADFLLAQCLKIFDKIWVIQGNHEARLYKQLGGTINPNRFFKMLGDYIGKKVLVSDYPYCFIGKEWMAVHPKGFSEMGGKTPVEIADVYQRNVIAGHNHMWGTQINKSGKFVGIDHGMSGNPLKIEYYNKNVTKGRRWQVGFSMIMNNKGYAFNLEHTDWKYWL